MDGVRRGQLCLAPSLLLQAALQVAAMDEACERNVSRWPNNPDHFVFAGMSETSKTYIRTTLV